MHLTLAKRQGGTTREILAKPPSLHWNVERLAASAHFSCVDVLPFECTQYEGYQPLREFKDQSFPFDGAQVHVFRHKRVFNASRGQSLREWKWPDTNSLT